MSLAAGSFEFEPFSFMEAISNPKWKAAMIHEFEALICNDTGKLVSPIDAQNLVARKWIFRIKYNSDGSLEH